MSTKNKPFPIEKGTIVTTPFCPKNLARARATLAQSTKDMGHSQTIALIHLPTRTKHPLLGPYSLVTLRKDRYIRPTFLYFILSSLHCLSVLVIFKERTTNIEEITFFSHSQPLPFSPLGITKKVNFLLKANSESLINLP